jgi:ribosomal-protein-alanine N-acetyltransferase
VCTTLAAALLLYFISLKTIGYSYMNDPHTLNLRSAIPKDLDKIYSLEQLCNKNSWSRNSLFEELSKISSVNTVLENGQKEIIGFLCSTLILNELHILEVAIHPFHRNKGLGCSLINHLLREAITKKVTLILLEVRVSNHSAIRVYEKCGFMRDALRIGYYQDGEDAILMSKTIN